MKVGYQGLVKALILQDELYLHQQQNYILNTDAV
jgi:hypothetical protein